MSETYDIKSVLELNELLKSLTEKTSQISLTAVNAMLAARSKSAAYTSFSVVTTELREFCEQLNLQVEKVLILIIDVVHNMSEIEKLGNTIRVLTTTELQIEKANTSNFTIVSIKEDEILIYDKLHIQLKQLLKTLSKALLRISKHCMRGDNISVLIKVESKSGMDNSTLELISNEVATYVVQIQDSLKHAALKITQGMQQ